MQFIANISLLDEVIDYTIVVNKYIELVFVFLCLIHLEYSQTYILYQRVLLHKTM